MFDTGASSETDFPIAEVIDGVYRWSTDEFGQPIGLSLFDQRLCEAIDFAWLAGSVSKDGVTERELTELLDKGILKGFSTPTGGTGFLLYSPEQVKTLKTLKGTDRYSDDELRHIMEMWNADIECTVEVLPYDDPEVSDYDHLRKKLSEYIGETKRQIGYAENDSTSADDDRDRALGHFRSELEKSERTARRLDSWNPNALTDQMKSFIGRSLFRLRWADEWVRIENAQQFQAKVLEGYSPEVFFSAWSHGSAGVTLERINWTITLQALQETRSQGKVFPLRTPEFDLVERGMILREPLTPDAYATLCRKFRIDELSQQMGKIGSVFGTRLENQPQALPVLSAEVRLPARSLRSSTAQKSAAHEPGNADTVKKIQSALDVTGSLLEELPGTRGVNGHFLYLSIRRGRCMAGQG